MIIKICNKVVINFKKFIFHSLLWIIIINWKEKKIIKLDKI